MKQSAHIILPNGYANITLPFCTKKNNEDIYFEVLNDKEAMSIGNEFNNRVNASDAFEDTHTITVEEFESFLRKLLLGEL